MTVGLLGFYRRMRWGSRRLRLPVSKEALVLEIGAGHNPYPRTDIVVDSRIEDYERLGALLHDRPLLLALGECLPFKDKCFGFVVASHVLEHSPHPRLFLEEVQRVGEAGLIETPVAVRERISPGIYHRLEVTVRNNKLFIRKKSAPVDDPWLAEAFRDCWGRHKGYIRFRKENPDAFACRLFWKGTIDFEIANEEANADWPIPADVVRTKRCLGRPTDWREPLRAISRRFLRPRRGVDLQSLLQCVTCRGGAVEETAAGFQCRNCGRMYQRVMGIPSFLPEKGP